MTHEKLLNRFVREFNKAVGFEDCDVYDCIEGLQYTAPSHRRREASYRTIALDVEVEVQSTTSPDFFNNFAKVQSELLRLIVVAFDAEILNDVYIVDSGLPETAMVRIVLEDGIVIRLYPDGRYNVKDYDVSFDIKSKNFKLSNKQTKRIINKMLSHCHKDCENEIEYTVRNLEELNETYKLQQTRLERMNYWLRSYS